MRITLDRTALTALIDKDPAFELDLKNAVLSEVGRRFFEKDSAKVIRDAGPELFKAALSSMQDDSDLIARVQNALNSSLVVRDTAWLSSKKLLSPDAQKLIDGAVSDARSSALSAARAKINEAFSEAIDAALKSAMEDGVLQSRIDARVNALVEREIEARAQAKFQERMAAARAALT